MSSRTSFDLRPFGRLVILRAALGRPSPRHLENTPHTHQLLTHSPPTHKPTHTHSLQKQTANTKRVRNQTALILTSCNEKKTKKNVKKNSSYYKVGPDGITNLLLARLRNGNGSQIVAPSPSSLLPLQPGHVRYHGPWIGHSH